MTTAKLLLHCPDKPGILAEVTDFITVNKGNIIYLDQYVDHVENIFFFKDFHLPAERRIGYEYIPLGRFIVEKILSVIDMGIHDMETGILEFLHKLTALRIERTPDYLAFGYIFDNG